jgi:hypothetical protein
VELQVSHCVHPEATQEGDLWCVAAIYDAVGESTGEKSIVKAFIQLLSPVLQNEIGVS